MKWDQMAKHTMAMAKADTTLLGIYGQKIRYAAHGALEIPVLELSTIADGQTELWEPCTIQWDQWVETMDQLRASERQLRRLFISEIPQLIGPVLAFCQYQDGAELDMPSRDNYFGRAVRFRLTPLRELYQPVV